MIEFWETDTKSNLQVQATGNRVRQRSLERTGQDFDEGRVFAGDDMVDGPLAGAAEGGAHIAPWETELA